MNATFAHKALSLLLTACILSLIHISFFFLWFLSQPMLEKLDRVKVKYGLLE